MTAHTPGPWLAECKCGDWLVVSEADTSAIAYPNYPRGDQVEANVRLIAAAPELLAFITEWLSRQGNDVNYMTEKARAAIAKAKGESDGR